MMKRLKSLAQLVVDGIKCFHEAFFLANTCVSNNRCDNRQQVLFLENGN